ncbi:Sec-independent protein secretion pathway component [Longilinea arvoryzae]|uniref:Sec-independent protein secretion pathway component n=1 Tax=Longilinea arvoryzae TaxID=360412 RepID=A0A0S7BEB9_9CHLR|nr:twin-arginine translocase TatA/TatE family subunit [Longilinea arvoryzae]GAP12322.1 Sec-independent protein secretion pathway component [Longilinea arvoryzae]
MDFLGIGLPELGLILVIVLIVLGPKDMVNTARRLARTIRLLTQSEFWRTTREAWKMAQELPNELLRESGLEETREELNKMGKDLNQWKREVDATLQPGNHRILPPARPAAQPQADDSKPQERPAGEPLPPEATPSDANSDQSTPAHG